MFGTLASRPLAGAIAGPAAEADGAIPFHRSTSLRMSDTATSTFTTDQREREASGAHSYGRYLEEFEVGDVYKHWPAKTVTESDDHLFCLITMNHHPLHLNDVYAAQSQQKRNVVVGPLVYSLALGMSVSDVSGKAIANLATEELSHPNPVFHGDTLFVETEVLEKKESQEQARPRRRQGPHQGAQPGRRARGGVQAPRARAAQEPGDARPGRGQRRVRGAGAPPRLSPLTAAWRLFAATGVTPSPGAVICSTRGRALSLAPIAVSRSWSASQFTCPPPQEAVPSCPRSPFPRETPVSSRGSMRSPSSPSPRPSTGATARPRSTTGSASCSSTRGTFRRLSDAKRPNSYLGWSDPTTSRASRTARSSAPSASRTRARRTTGRTRPRCARSCDGLFDGAMRGRTLYVVPFSMGPLGSDKSYIGVQLTDSPYVAVSMRIMTRMGQAALDAIGEDGAFVPCLHTVGAPLEDGQADVAVAVQRRRSTSSTSPRRARSGRTARATAATRCSARSASRCGSPR